MPQRPAHTSRHPKLDRLQAFFLAKVDVAERREIGGHLLGGCERCLARMRRWNEAPTSLPPKFARRGPSDAYDVVLQKAVNLAALADAARKNALAEIQPLLANGPLKAENHPLIALSRALALLERARSLRRGAVETYELAAVWALRAAQGLPVETPSPQDHADHLARAWAEVGNAHRRRHDYSSAEKAIEAAMSAAAEGRYQPTLLAELLDLSSSLWADLHRFEEAERQVALAESLYRSVGNLRSAIHACMSLGRYLSQRGQQAEAVRQYCRGLDDLDPAHEPLLWATALYNVVAGLNDLGEHRVAEQVFGQVRELIERHVQADDRVRLLWLAGRIELGLGRYHRAEVSLRKARNQFAQMNLPFLAALANLDLCQVWLHEGRTVEVRAAVEQILGQFTARGIAREALAALVLLEQAARQEQATLALLEEAAKVVVGLERGGR